MGFPLRANIFKPGKREQRDFARFPVQAVVLFSGRQAEFSQSFGDLFYQLDRLTAGSVAFFAVLDPPDEWRTLPHAQAWSRQHGMFATSDIGFSHDDDVLVDALARTFSVDWTELPVIIASPNLWLGEYVVAPTAASAIEHQLCALTELVHRWGRPNIGLLLDALTTDAGEPDYRANATLQDRLSSAYEFVDLCVNQDSSGFRKAASRRIAQLHRALKRFRKDAGLRRHPARSSNRFAANIMSDDESEEAVALAQSFDEALIEINSQLVVPATLARRFSDRLNDRGPEGVSLVERLDQQSEIMIRGAVRIGEMLEGEQSAAENLVEDTDFTPAAQGYWKSFEREVNLSIVQAARAARGVPMPGRFTLYDPELPKERAVVCTGPDHQVHLNQKEWQRKTEQHRFLTLGPVRFGYDAMHTNPDERLDGLLSKAGVSFSNDFWQAWKRIERVRNIGSHTNVLPYSDYKSLVSLFECAGLFEPLIALKCELMPKNT